MRDFKSMYKFVGFGLGVAAFGLSMAWADEKVTIIKTDSDGKVTIRHDAISDAPDESYSTVTVKTAPPELKNEDEFSKARPDDKAVWIPGYWRWDTHTAAYEWMPGLWRRQIPNETWHAGQWINTDGNYAWQTGYWSSEAEGKLIFVKEAPPALREEVQGTAPGPGQIWIPGVWKYDGAKYNWIAGSWEHPASEDMSWVRGVWFKTGAGYEYVPGHWDYTASTRTYVVKVN